MVEENYVLYKSQLDQERKKSWEDCIQPLAKFSKFEVFRKYYTDLKPSELGVNTDYSLFKDGFKPDWYDSVNVKGGRYVLSHLETMDPVAFNELWLRVVEFVMTPNFPGAEGVVGALVKVRSRPKLTKTISIWCSSATTFLTRIIITKKLKEKLELERIFFEFHQVLEQRSFDNRNPKGDAVHRDSAKQDSVKKESKYVQKPELLSWRKK